MVALACVQQLHDRGERLPFSVRVVAFADEEGLRFGTTFLGSSVYTGTFDKSHLSLEDREGVTLAQAIRVFGGDPEALEQSGRGSADLLGYCEVHIEQGPVLEHMSDLRITAGPYEFMARWERERAPETCEAFEGLLPFRNKVIHVRWSGESA
jgi:hypothetical protein